MKEKIIDASIESLRHEGLKFSVDTLADKLKISKKTIYKHFPDKETLALALYDKYYTDAKKQAAELIKNTPLSFREELLQRYYDSKFMTRGDIFNKYIMNQSLRSYTTKQNDALWNIISSSFQHENTETDVNAIRIIVDGSFEKLCNDGLNPGAVIERLVNLLW